MSDDTEVPYTSAEMSHLVVEFIFWFAPVLLTVLCGGRWWLIYQGIFTFVAALMCFISPHFTFDTVMESLVGDYDDCHIFTIRFFSLIYLFWGLALLICLTLTDNRAVSALMEGLCVMYALESVCHLIIWIRKPTEDPAHYPEKGLPVFLSMMLGNFLHLVVGQTGYSDFGKQSINLNSRFDALVRFITGGSIYAYSEDILALVMMQTRFDSAHVEILSVAGCYILCSAVVSLRSDVFTQETRQKMYLGRIVESMCCIAFIFYYLLFHDCLRMTSLWFVLIYGMLALNALVAVKKLPTKKID